MDRKTEIQLKLAKVASMLQEHQLDGLIISRRDNYSWMTAGSQSHVAVNVEEGAASLCVTPDRITLLTTNIESPRFAAEEVADLGIEIQHWPWPENKNAKIAALIAGRSFGSDNGIAGTKNLAGEIASLRYSLLPGEVERYRKLGREAAIALESAARSIRPGMTEWQISAALANEVMSHGMEPTVNLVAVDERIRLFRHPVPTAKVLAKHAMLVLCARRGGLVVACTRLVYFGRLPEELRRKHQAVCNIEAALYANSQPGVTLGAALAAGITAYAEAGYADEWQLHHQGGPTGYANREYLATPGSTTAILDAQPIAWNPSITGAKGEDTILTGQAGPVLITVGDGTWPQIKASYQGETLMRPDVLTL